MIYLIQDLGIRGLPRVYFHDACALVGQVFEKYCSKLLTDYLKVDTLT